MRAIFGVPAAHEPHNVTTELRLREGLTRALMVGYTDIPARTVYVLTGMVLIWKTAPGSSLISAWTVATMPRAASAPRTMPQGNDRNYLCEVHCQRHSFVPNIDHKLRRNIGVHVLVERELLLDHLPLCSFEQTGGNECLSRRRRPICENHMLVTLEQPPGDASLYSYCHCH